MTARSADPRTLILETSGRVGRVALAHGAKIVAEQTLDEMRRHARDLAPTVAELCRQCGWRVRDLEAVLVSRGPGSYTGLRVGIMSAKTLAYATGCTLLAIDTFAAIARQAPPEAHQLHVLADAQQQKIYVQSWERSNSGWRSTATLTVRPIAEWLADLTPGTWVTGPGLRACESQLAPETPRVSEEKREARPTALLEIGLEHWRTGKADDFWALEPLYLRPSNAEKNWKK
jgi:tRNA threonylcarbamoyladenosine biosynthesis protein TsaB